MSIAIFTYTTVMHSCSTRALLIYHTCKDEIIFNKMFWPFVYECGTDVQSLNTSF